MVTPLGNGESARCRITHRIEVEGPEAQTLGPQVTDDEPSTLKDIARLAEAKVMGLTSLYVNDVKASAAVF